MADINWKKQLQERTEMSEEEINEKIKEIVNEYEGLVSRESAPILIGREKGIDLVEESNPEKNTELEIENIVPGIKSLRIIGTVLEVQDEYNPSGEDYRVTSVKVGDETGVAEISFWNEDSDQAQKLSEGLKLELIEAYTKEDPSEYHMDRYGVPGISISDSSKVIVYNNQGEEKVLLEPE